MSAYECAICRKDYDSECRCIEPIKRLKGNHNRMRPGLTPLNLGQSAVGSDSLARSWGDPDMVNSPPHYNTGEVECLDAMISAFGLEKVRDHAKLCAFKYLWRAGNKGSAEEDLGKAVFYTRFANGDDPRQDN